MQLNEKSTKFELFNEINKYSNFSFYFSIKLKLNKYLESSNNNNNNGEIVKKIIDIILEPERLLSTDLNDRVNFFDNPISNHELLLPIKNRIERIKEFKKEIIIDQEQDRILEELINDLINGYSNSIEKFIFEAIKNKDSKQRMNIYQFKVNLISEDLKFRDLDLKLAYQISSYDPSEFDYVRMNSSGNSIGRKLDNIYYKVDNGSRLLRPAKEDANYRFYCGLFGIDQKLISPTQLLILSKIPILPSNLIDSPERKLMHEIKRAQGFKTSKEVFVFDPELKKKVEDAMMLERTISIQSSLFREGISFQDFLEDLEKQENPDSILESSIDLYSFSSHILASLLLIPTDYKPDNLILDLNTKQIIGIDNDQCLESDEFQTTKTNTFINIKNILYTLSSLMNKPIDDNAKDQFISQTPELFILDWLFQLYEKEKLFTQMVENSLLTTIYPDEVSNEKNKSIFNINESLGLPLLFPEGWIDALLYRFIKIKKIFIKNKQVTKETTHQQLFNEIHPLASAYYDSLARYYPLPMDQISSLYQNNTEFQRILTIHPPSDTFFQQLSEKTFIQSVPTISIKESIIDFISKLNVNDLHSSTSTTVFLEIVELFIKISKEFEINTLQFESLWYSSIQKSLLLLIKQGAKEYTIRRFLSLLDIKSNQLERDENNNTKSIIHLILLKHLESIDLTLVINGITILKSLGANIDMIENGYSPLDVVAGLKSFKCFKLFKVLVELGAGKNSSDSIINKFYSSLSYEQKSEIKETIEKLSIINPKIGWILSLNHLFPLIKPTTSYDKNKLLLTTTRGNRIISEDQWNLFFDKDGQPNKNNTYGKRCVSFIQDLDHRIYIKFEPQFPGTELAVSFLGYQLFGFISPFSELAMINGIPVLLVQEIKGVTLNEFLLDDPSKLSLLNSSNISKLLVLEMLINNADGNLGNYIINSNIDNSYQIFSIDNDQSFVPPITKEIKTGFFSNKFSLQVETCLFLFDQMNDLVHQDVIECLKEKDLVFEIRKWIDSLKSYHIQWIEFFKNNQIKTTNENKSIIGVSFVPNQIKLLFSKAVRLLNLLKKPINHFQLLESLEPLIANRYKTIFKLLPEKHSIYKRYKYLKNNNSQSLTSSMYSSVQILESRDIPTVDSIQRDIFSGQYGPENALLELKEIQSQHTSIQQILKDLGNEGGNLQKITSINNLTDALLEEFLKKSDFNLLSTAQEQFLLKLIKGKELVNLYIRNSSTLKMSTLVSYNFNSLSILNLSRCHLLTSISNNNLLIKGPINFPCLKKFRLDHCTNLLEVILIANNLEYFSATNCVLLGTVFKLDAPNIKYLNLSNGSLSHLDTLLSLKNFKNLTTLDLSNNQLKCLPPSIKLVNIQSKTIIKHNLKNFPAINHPNRDSFWLKRINIFVIGYYANNFDLIGKILANSDTPHIPNNTTPVGSSFGHTDFNGFKYRFLYQAEYYGFLSNINIQIPSDVKTIILFFNPSLDDDLRIIDGYYRKVKSTYNHKQFNFILFGACVQDKDEFPKIREFLNQKSDIKLIYSVRVNTVNSEIKIQKELFDYIEKLN